MQAPDWIKFFPFAWTFKHGASEIQGPYFPTPRKNRWNFGDSRFSFKAPWANPILGFEGRGRTVDAKSPGSANILAAKNLTPVVGGGADDAPVSAWRKNWFYSRTWYFVGPWFIGEKARLKAGGLLFTADDRYAFAGTNLFHPRAFESAVADYLDQAYGYQKHGKKPHYRGPLNWRVLPLSNTIQGVVCDIHCIGNSSKENPTLRRLVFFPVSPNQFIRFMFDFVGVEIYRDKIKAPPLFKLCDSIIDSMRLEVGASTQAEWDKVKATCPDMSITETFGEFPWPLFKEKAPKKHKLVDVTPDTGSPKPIPHNKQ